MIFQFGIPTKTLFGVGQLNHLHEQMMPGKKVLCQMLGYMLLYSIL